MWLPTAIGNPDWAIDSRIVNKNHRVGTNIITLAQIDGSIQILAFKTIITYNMLHLAQLKGTVQLP